MMFMLKNQGLLLSLWKNVKNFIDFKEAARSNAINDAVREIIFDTVLIIVTYAKGE